MGPPLPSTLHRCGARDGVVTLLRPQPIGVAECGYQREPTRNWKMIRLARCSIVPSRSCIPPGPRSRSYGGGSAVERRLHEGLRRSRACVDYRSRCRPSGSPTTTTVPAGPTTAPPSTMRCGFRATPPLLLWVFGSVTMPCAIKQRSSDSTTPSRFPRGGHQRLPRGPRSRANCYFGHRSVRCEGDRHADGHGCGDHRQPGHRHGALSRSPEARA